VSKRARYRPILLGTAFIAALSAGGCAVAPQSDGGIVGTGNRIDCEAQPKQGAMREDCASSARVKK
jgi:hypothetical protein